MKQKRTLFRRPIDIFDKAFYALVIIAVPMIIVEYFFNISSDLREVFELYFYGIYVTFVIEFLFRLFLSKSKKSYIVNNWVEIVIIFFPFIRLLSLVPILAEAFLIAVDELSRKFLRPRHLVMINVFVFMLFVVILSSGIILVLEKPFTDSGIKSFPDAVWWSVVGASTIGIANLVPVSVGGKILTIFITIVGMFVLSMITANIAAIFTETDIKKDLDKELKIIEGDINKVEDDMKKEVRIDDKLVEDRVGELEKKISELKANKE